MKILIYESWMGADPFCVYETDVAEIIPYAIDAYNGKHVDDIVFNKDDYISCRIDFDNKVIVDYDEETYPFDVAIDAKHLIYIEQKEDWEDYDGE